MEGEGRKEKKEVSDLTDVVLRIEGNWSGGRKRGGGEVGKVENVYQTKSRKGGKETESVKLKGDYKRQKKQQEEKKNNKTDRLLV